MGGGAYPRHAEAWTPDELLGVEPSGEGGMRGRDQGRAFRIPEFSNPRIHKLPSSAPAAGAAAGRALAQEAPEEGQGRERDHAEGQPALGFGGQIHSLSFEAKRL